ncbi:MAG: Peptidoglycan-binding domain 1 [Acidobacteriales bacterium]|nr:Peptidoglycan-binding domain 1 [Terriglobales bacterium]
MRHPRYIGLIALIFALSCLAPAAWAKTSKSTHHKTTGKSAKTGSKTAKSKSKKSRKAWQAKGQKTISDDRTREIQAALIRDKYLSGQPSGQMDAATRQALVRLQQENGWQTKIVPDSRALIKLGLGPSHENLLNPDSAAVQSSVASRQ